jgi:3-oxoacyl-[acyl-carrier protein] reductase
MKLLQNKVAIVTGGSRDIGAAVSSALANEGASVCINYLNNEDAAKATLQQVIDVGANGIIVKGDMTKAIDAENVVSQCKAAFGDSIDVLINVAGGLMARKVLADIEEDFWDNVININLKSTFLVTKAVVPNMTNGGTIVNFSSQAARDGGGFGALAYSSLKTVSVKDFHVI